MAEIKTPESLVPHETDYHPRAWEDYTLAELGWWIHLLATRSAHRSDPVKKTKDLEDAKNYLAMMSAKLESLS